MRITRDTPAYYLTTITKDRLPVFRKDKLKEIAANAFAEACRSHGLLLLAYVIMPDHTHLITGCSRAIRDTLRYLNGISANRVIRHLKENNHESSLAKLREQEKERGYKHSLWQHHPDAFRLTSEEMLMQKVNYIHQNPVRAGLVEKAEDYIYSSARIWTKRPLEQEPLELGIDQIEWRTR